MIKKCPWCKQKYDTSKGETSIACEKNPRGRNYKKLKPHIVKITCLVIGGKS